ncbi:hypothetical protein JOQ06_019524 [Pogonophryne albipinna]|uniref:THAP-type domain-containing protein n=1 Tax=Pogonophryne albipinna TaxID=1090488 RepID=A0AAD6AD80_9TELE|nr:hypothetical protein JOQ06_019524 [Pogonophryne albipinna]
MRKKWEVALRREGFTASESSVICSEHFKQDEFDRTGQIVRLRDGVIPSSFSFPVHLQRAIVVIADTSLYVYVVVARPYVESSNVGGGWEGATVGSGAGEPGGGTAAQGNCYPGGSSLERASERTENVVLRRHDPLCNTSTFGRELVGLVVFPNKMWAGGQDPLCTGLHSGGLQSGFWMPFVMSLGYLVNTSTLCIILTPQLCDSGGYVESYLRLSVRSDREFFDKA